MRLANIKLPELLQILLTGVYDKRLDFNFKVNSLTNWYSCISKKFLKNISFSQLARIKRIRNNSDNFMLANHNLSVIANNNGFPPHLLTVSSRLYFKIVPFRGSSFQFVDSFSVVFCCKMS